MGKNPAKSEKTLNLVHQMNEFAILNFSTLDIKIPTLGTRLLKSDIRLRTIYYNLVLL